MFCLWKRKTSQLFHEPENSADDWVPVTFVSLRPTLAYRSSEGSDTAGEGIRGSAALLAKRWSIGGEANQGERLLHCSVPSLHSQRCVTHRSWHVPPQMVSKLPVMKSICNLHIDKLEFFRLVHPETAYTFPPLYREVFGSEVTFPDSTEG